MWIGTYKGLNRYDGTRIKNYGRQDLGVKSDYINVLAEDSAGNVLIGTDNGIVIYDYRKDSFRQPLQAELLDDRIYSIQNDSKGISWIGSRAQGLFIYDPETDAVSKIDLKNPEGKLVRDIYRIVIDRNDKMHVAVYCDNLYRLTGDFAMERITTPGKSGYFEKDDIEGLVLNPSSSNQMFIASKRHGLCRLDLRTGEVSVLVTLPADSRPVYLSENDGILWLATSSGVVKYSVENGTCSTLKHDNADNSRCQTTIPRRQSRPPTEACLSEQPRKALIIIVQARIYSRNSTRPPMVSHLTAVLSAALPRTGTASYGSHLKGTG